MTFKDFWLGTNNPSLSKSEYLFGTKHIILLVSAIFFAVLIGILFHNKSEKAKLILLRIAAYILLTFEILSRIINFIKCENFTIEAVAKIILPMHICSVIVWVAIIAILSRKQFLINFAAIGGILATTAFLLYPAVGINKVYMTFDCLYSTLSHAIGFISSISLITLGFTKFNFKDIWKTYLCFTVMFLWGVLLDFVIFPGSDYMYIVNDPLELELKYPYQILYGAALVLYILAFYLITYLTRKIKDKKTKEN